jgi:hypothetical protein
MFIYSTRLYILCFQVTDMLSPRIDPLGIIIYLFSYCTSVVKLKEPPEWKALKSFLKDHLREFG